MKAIGLGLVLVHEKEKITQLILRACLFFFFTKQYSNDSNALGRMELGTLFCLTNLTHICYDHAFNYCVFHVMRLRTHLLKVNSGEDTMTKHSSYRKDKTRIHVCVFCIAKLALF